MLRVDVRHRLGAFALEAALEAPAGAVTAIVGESGAGKSTLLRLVAGLARPDEGRITLAGAVLVDRANGTFAPPESRAIGWVAQDYALFPHLSALENVAFGLRARGERAHDAREKAHAALARFGLDARAAAHPRSLSGGEQQRVALARALVLEPAALLLDEPLAALDPRTRRAVRGELRHRLEGLPCVTLLVTHDPADALALGDRIAALEDGRVTQADAREAFVRHPRTAYAAEFLGLNRIVGRVHGPAAGGLAHFEAGGATLAVPDPGAEGPATVLLHPHDVTLSLEPPAGSARNVLAGAIAELVPEPPAGDRVRVLLATRPPLAATVSRAAIDAMELARGTIVHASFKATAVRLLPD